MSSAAAGERVPFIAGNWKMHETVREAEQLIDQLLPLLGSGAGASAGSRAAASVGSRADAEVGSGAGAEVAVCPPFTALSAVVGALAGSGVGVFAQNMHFENAGAFTGEVSAPMLSELGVGGVILGHSERREMFGETDRALALKVPAALAAGLVPILCVGETEEEREAEETERKLRHQVQEDLARLATEQLGEVVIAYEPIWAIGTGRVATPEQAQDAIAFIRALVAGRSPEQAERTRVLYGGSVNAENAAELLALPDVDGALVGGASLGAESFAQIVSAAGQ